MLTTLWYPASYIYLVPPIRPKAKAKKTQKTARPVISTPRIPPHVPRTYHFPQQRIPTSEHEHPHVFSLAAFKEVRFEEREEVRRLEEPVKG